MSKNRTGTKKNKTKNKSKTLKYKRGIFLVGKKSDPYFVEIFYNTKSVWVHKKDKYSKNLPGLEKYALGETIYDGPYTEISPLKGGTSKAVYSKTMTIKYPGGILLLE